MYWRLATDAASEPITAAQAKTHCVIDTDDDDTYIAILIKAARQQVEDDSDRAILNQTWKIYCDDFPASSSEPLYMPRSPLVSVTSIKYTDTNGDQQTWDSDEYDVDIYTEPARIIPAYGYTWPSSRGDASNVIIESVHGYGAAIGDATLLPSNALMAMYMLIAHWYERREAVMESNQRGGFTTLPLGYEGFINKLKVGWHFDTDDK